MRKEFLTKKLDPNDRLTRAEFAVEQVDILDVLILAAKKSYDRSGENAQVLRNLRHAREVVTKIYSCVELGNMDDLKKQIDLIGATK